MNIPNFEFVALTAAGAAAIVLFILAGYGLKAARADTAATASMPGGTGVCTLITMGDTRAAFPGVATATPSRETTGDAQVEIADSTVTAGVLQNLGATAF